MKAKNKGDNEVKKKQEKWCLRFTKKILKKNNHISANTTSRTDERIKGIKEKK